MVEAVSGCAEKEEDLVTGFLVLPIVTFEILTMSYAASLTEISRECT